MRTKHPEGKPTPAFPARWPSVSPDGRRVEPGARTLELLGGGKPRRGR